MEVIIKSTNPEKYSLEKVGERFHTIKNFLEDFGFEVVFSGLGGNGFQVVEFRDDLKIVDKEIGRIRMRG